MDLIVSVARVPGVGEGVFVSIEACSQIIAWSNSRLKIDIDGIDDQKIVVARERVREFKSWLDS